MGKPYSLDLRERIVAYVDGDHSAREAARVFGVSASTAIRLVSAQRGDGNLMPKRQGRAPGTAGKLAPHQDFLVARVKSEPDITLRELAVALEDAVGLRVDLSSIHRALDRAGFSYKKRLGGVGT